MRLITRINVKISKGFFSVSFDTNLNGSLNGSLKSKGILNDFFLTTFTPCLLQWHLLGQVIVLLKEKSKTVRQTPQIFKIILRSLSRKFGKKIQCKNNKSLGKFIQRTVNQSVNVIVWKQKTRHLTWIHV